MPIQDNEKAKWLEGLIKDFINHSPENTLQNPDGERAWSEPLVGFARGDDPIFASYKEHVGDFHFTPLEIFNLSYPGADVKAEELSVISWILPQTENTRVDNRKETFYPAERWARSRIFGEQTNVKLRNLVATALEEAGHAAVAPMLSPFWESKTSDRFVFASNWSERHAAHAAGLGTFGLCDGLITPVGKAIRVGSVVARINIPATPRPYQTHQEYCLFYSKGTCGKCIKRCPVDALSEAGHDKVKCLAHLQPVTEDYVKENFKFDGYGCGLCQTGVPCESRIPGPKEG